MWALCVIDMSETKRSPDSDLASAGLFWLGSAFSLYGFYENLERWKLGEELYFVRSIVDDFSPGFALWIQGMLGFIFLAMAIYKTIKFFGNT